MWTIATWLIGITLLAQNNPPAVNAAAASTVSVQLKRPPVCEPAGTPVSPESAMRHVVGQRVVGSCADSIKLRWLDHAAIANPAMLAMFQDRDLTPYRNLLPWSGEFAGKHLTGATQLLSLDNPGEQLLATNLLDFVEAMTSLQDRDDGYLGPFPRAYRLTGQAPNVDGKNGPTWDAWGHYHAMIGLILWHEKTGHEAALLAAQKIGDLLCDRFLGPKKSPRLVDTGSTEMNLAPAHSLAVLYRKTGQTRYLDLARQIVDQEFAAKTADGQPLAGDYLNLGLAETPFYQGPRPRWESLHPIMALSELAMITGDERYARAFENLWWSIAETDIHNHGGFSSGEQAQGNPYHPGAVETCCTVAWMAMSVEMLRLTGEPIVADELERSTYNAGLGAWHPSGAWSTYNTPMDGTRRANYDEIVFQARPGSPQLNCCSVNAPRLIGLLSDWRLMRDADGLRLNAYEAGHLETSLDDGTTVNLELAGSYPIDPNVVLRIGVSKPSRFALKLRIPHWSTHTTITVDGQPTTHPKPGSYQVIDRQWQETTSIRIGFDFTPHVAIGERECEGRASVFQGPILLVVDQRLNPDHPEATDPALDLAQLGASVRVQGTTGLVGAHVPQNGGPALLLSDFATAGRTGGFYRSWLKTTGNAPPPIAFSRTRPWRTQPIAVTPPQ